MTTADSKISTAAGVTGAAAPPASDLLQFLRRDGVYVVPGDAEDFSVSGVLTVDGVATLDGGTDTAGSAPVLTSLGSTNGGSAIQLSDKTRDYMVYLTVTAAGTATTVEMGHSSAASDVVIVSDSGVGLGVISFRLPAGWWFKWAGTTTAIANQNAVGC